MYYKWLVDHIIKTKVKVKWINGPTIYKNKQSFTSKVWWLIRAIYNQPKMITYLMLTTRT